jgi:hypothetical protein
MDFDFENYYSGYSTKELLKIIEQHQDYRPEAIAVIQKILAARPDATIEASKVKTEALDDFFEKHRKQERLEKKFALFFRLQALVKRPSLIKQDDYLILFLQVILSIYYLLLLPQRVKRIYLQFEYFEDAGIFFTALNLLALISTPIILYLLSRKDKTGWILSAIGKTTELIFCCYNFWIILIKYADYSPTKQKTEASLYLLLVIGILVILLYPQTQKALGATKKQRLFALVTGCVAAILLFLVSALYQN